LSSFEVLYAATARTSMPRTPSGSTISPGATDMTWPATRSATVGGPISQVLSVDSFSTSAGEKWS
jgi:hypothetical protein